MQTNPYQQKVIARDGDGGRDWITKGHKRTFGMMYDCYLDCDDSLMGTEVDLRVPLKVLTLEVRIWNPNP